MSTLDTLAPGASARVTALLGSGPLHQRLLEMGLFEGTDVEVVRFAPLGDPMEILVQGYHLSLRKSEAALVEVEVL